MLFWVKEARQESGDCMEQINSRRNRGDSSKQCCMGLAGLQSRLQALLFGSRMFHVMNWSYRQVPV